jgi:hypothetical protein
LTAKAASFPKVLRFAIWGYLKNQTHELPP